MTHLCLASLLLRVPIHVTLEFVLAAEGTWTHVARVRPLTRVCPHVPLQMGRPGERRRTIVALQHGEAEVIRHVYSLFKVFGTDIAIYEKAVKI